MVEAGRVLHRTSPGSPRANVDAIAPRDSANVRRATRPPATSSRLDTGHGASRRNAAARSRRRTRAHRPVRPDGSMITSAPSSRAASHTAARSGPTSTLNAAALSRRRSARSRSARARSRRTSFQVPVPRGQRVRHRVESLELDGRDNRQLGAVALGDQVGREERLVTGAGRLVHHEHVAVGHDLQPNSPWAHDDRRRLLGPRAPRTRERPRGAAPRRSRGLSVPSRNGAGAR